MNMTRDNEDKFDQVKSVLMMIVDDQSVPKNIRHAAKTSIDSLNSNKMTAAVRAYGVIRRLDDASQSPNCPLHARTRMWQVVSVLETVMD